MLENCKCIEFKEIIENQNSKITCLEYEIDDLKIENQELKIENHEFKKKITILENIIITLNIKINNLEFEKIINKIITAIQDINSKNNLEKLILKKSLFKLRKLRNNNNHYIDEDCNDYEINCRKLYLLLKLKELTPEQINTINNRICKNEDLIGEITKYLDSNIDKTIKINEDIVLDE
jgi:hypothetical protein